jgi:hypothetical protein
LFGVLGSNNIRQLKYIIFDAPVEMKTRFHVPGTNGNVVIYHGKVARRINAHLIYLGPLQSIYDAYEEDVQDWYSIPGTIIDQSGVNHTRCNLESMSRSEPTGCDGDEAFFFANATFTQDD